MWQLSFNTGNSELLGIKVVGNNIIKGVFVRVCGLPPEGAIEGIRIEKQLSPSSAHAAGNNLER